MNAEFFDALDLLEKEKGIPKEYMVEKVKAAIVAAVKRDKAITGDNIKAEVDYEKKSMRFAIVKEVVEEVENPQTQMSLEDAKSINRRFNLGSMVEIEVETKNFGRIAAKIGKNVIIQSINEAVNGSVVQEFEGKQNEILTAVVNQVDPNTKAAVLQVDRHELMLPVREQIAGEVLKEGERIKIYVVEVKKKEKDMGGRGHEVIISRTHPGLVRRLFELEVPEISDGTVEVMSIAREAGARTKIAVMSKDPDVDPIGACIGPRRARIERILSEIKGEKIDIIKYNEDPAKYIAEALSPAKITNVVVDVETKSCRASVPADQLSLAIGREGQNARLSAKLTGWKIDIKPDNE